jgi:hypothetical protein
LSRGRSALYMLDDLVEEAALGIIVLSDVEVGEV